MTLYPDIGLEGETPAKRLERKLEEAMEGDDVAAGIVTVLSVELLSHLRREEAKDAKVMQILDRLGKSK